MKITPSPLGDPRYSLSSPDTYVEPDSVESPFAHLESVDQPSNLRQSKSKLDLLRKSLHDVGKLFSNKSREDVSIENLRIYIVSWNMSAKIPDINIAPLFKPGLDSDPHIIVVGTQECQNSIERSLLQTSKQEWESMLKYDIGADYFMACSETLNGIHLAVFVKKSIASELMGVQAAKIATGVGNIIGNKGATLIALKFPAFDIAFVNSHLPGGVVCPLIDLKHTTESLFGFKKIDADVKNGEISDRFDYTFFFGDLNYRVNASRQTANDMIANGEIQAMLAMDQLNIERYRGRAFAGYEEAPIHFYPTFKFDTVCNLVGSKKLDSFLSKRVLTDEMSVSRSFSMTRQFAPLSFTAIGTHYTPPYDSSSKQRIPSWTDRILFKCKALSAPETDTISLHLVKCHLYSSLMEFHCSDHKPVVGVFSLSHGINLATFTQHDRYLKHRSTKLCCCAIQ